MVMLAAAVAQQQHTRHDKLPRSAQLRVTYAEHARRASARPHAITPLSVNTRRVPRVRHAGCHRVTFAELMEACKRESLPLRG